MGLFRRTRPEPEFRDPKAATVRLSMTGPGQPLVPKLSADRAITLGYLGNVVAYRCIEVVAQAVASVPFRAGLERPDTPTGIAPYNPDARLARLLGPSGSAAPGWSAPAFWAWLVTQRYATGRSGSEIETTGEGGDGQVVALWPLVSAMLDAIPTDGGNAPFARFAYGPWHKKKQLSPAQVLYGWFPHPEDYRQAKSPLLAAQTALSIALQSDRHADALLRNNAVPDTLIVIEEFAEDDDREAFQRQWNTTHQGAGNAGKTQFVEAERDSDGKLGEAVSVHQLGMSPKDARLIERHREALGHIAIALGVPWSRLDASGRTFDNAKQEDLVFWRDTMMPLLATLESEVNAQLAPRVGGEVGWFDLSNVEALRPPLTVQEAITLASAGFITGEELRLRAGFAGPVPEKVEVPDDSEPGGVGGQGGSLGEGSEAEGEGAGREAAPQDRGTRQGEVEARATEDQEIRRGRLWSEHDALVRSQERTWERSFRALFARQSESTVDRLTQSARSKRIVEGRASVGDIFDPAFWAAQTEAQASALYEQLATAAFVRMADRLGVSFDLLAEGVDEFVTARANQLAGQVTTTTYEAIKAQLAEGIGAGEGIPELSARVRTVFEDASAVRAATIARTEVIGGFGAATRAAVTALPGDVVAGVQWIATRDGRTRDTHASADGQIVSVSAPFQVGGSSMLYPGDPAGPAGETVNCRCALAALTPEEFEAEAEAYALAPPPVSLERARVALALVVPGSFEEARFRRALEAA